MTTTAKIRAKGLSATGITEDLAAKMFANKGARYMAIVELKVDETHEKSDGDRKVDLILTEVEPVVDGQLNGQIDETVRRIQRALYMNRQLTTGGDAQLDLDDDEPTVTDVLAAAAALVETDDEGEVTGLWDGNTDQDDAPADDEDLEEPADTAPATVPNPFSAVPS